MSAPLRPAVALALLCLAEPVSASSLKASLAAPLAAMPLAFARPHALSRAEARERVHQLLDYWRARFGVQGSWDGDTVRVWGRVLGVPFQGLLEVREHEVAARTSDPGFFMRGSALGYVERTLSKYLHPTYEER